MEQGGPLIQYDRCPFKEGKSGHSKERRHREDAMRRQRNRIDVSISQGIPETTAS